MTDDRMLSQVGLPVLESPRALAAHRLVQALPLLFLDRLDLLAARRQRLLGSLRGFRVVGCARLRQPGDLLAGLIFDDKGQVRA
jgi:hypothetical protein